MCKARLRFRRACLIVSWRSGRTSRGTPTRRGSRIRTGPRKKEFVLVKLHTYIHMLLEVDRFGNVCGFDPYEGKLFY